jgi:competence protein ComEC
MVLIFFIAGIFSHLAFLYFPFFISTCLLILLLFLIRKRFFIPLLLLIAGLFYPYFKEKPLLNDLPQKLDARIVFSSDRALESGGYEYGVKIKRCNWHTCPEDVRIFLNEWIEPATEAEIEMKLRLKKPSLVPGLYGRPYYIGYPLRLKIIGKSSSISSKIETQRQRLYNLWGMIDPRASGLARTLITGIKTLDSQQREDFRKTGLSHLLTISGTHFGILFFLSFIFIKRICLLLPYTTFHRLTTYISIDLISGLITIPLLSWYLIVSGMEVPAIRSFIMAVLFVTGLVIGRSYYWFAGLIVAATVILLIEPSSLFDLSFLLSFSAVLSIGVLFEKMRIKRLPQDSGQEGRVKRRISRFLLHTLLISLAASIGTLPLVAYYFHYIPLIGVLSNIIVTPFVCLVILPMLLLISLFYLVTGYYFGLELISLLINIALKIVNALANLPFAEIPVLPFPFIFVFILYGLLLLAINKNKSMRYLGIIGLTGILFFISFRTDKGPYITFLDVQQGDSAVIEMPDGKVIVVDTGRTGIETMAYLRYRGRREIHVLILTHPDKDHTGGLKLLKDNFRIKEIWDNGLIEYSPEYNGITKRSLTKGDIIRTKDYSIMVFNPERFYIFQKEQNTPDNNASLVFKVIYGDISVLFAGDIGIEAEESLLSLGEELSSDVLKVPHHGSKYSAHRSFFELVSPTLSIISAGPDNPYGHPHKETLLLLKGSNIKITSRDGSIKAILSEGLSVKIYKDYRLKKVQRPFDEVVNIRNLFRIF